MVWKKIQRSRLLVRSHYGKSGIRRQTSLGLRSKETEAIKLEYERGRSDAQQRLKNLKAVHRSAGRHQSRDRARPRPADWRKDYSRPRPSRNARIGNPGTRHKRHLRLRGGRGRSHRPRPDRHRRHRLAVRCPSQPDFRGERRRYHSLRCCICCKKSIAASIVRSQKFQAANRDGYLVDLIKPLRNPPWQKEKGPNWRRRGRPHSGRDRRAWPGMKAHLLSRPSPSTKEANHAAS